MITITNCSCFLYVIAFSVSHVFSVLSLYNMVKETQVVVMKSSSDVLHFKKLYKDLSWRQTFRRFLMAAPASVEDQVLLVQILQFLKAHVSTSASLGINLFHM